jgi:hypothetical protein
MSNSINRESLTTDLETRYSNQKAGGAFDAKKPTPGETFGSQEKIWTKGGFINANEEGLGLAGAKQYTKSMYLTGFNNKKYKE